MKVQYDEEADALYLELGKQQPEGVTEIEDVVNLDMTADGKITGIEILDASKKLDINVLKTYKFNFYRRPKKASSDKVALRSYRTIGQCVDLK